MRAPVMAATRLPYAPRAALKLASFLREDVPEIGFELAIPDAGAADASPASKPSAAPAAKRGCSGCTVSTTENPAPLAIAIPIVAWCVRRRRARR
jgi:hypothetical protein